MRNGLFVSFSSAMLVIALAPRRHAPPHVAVQQNAGAFELRAAWLAQRESALGDWQSVTPPLREGDELQLTVLASDDACVYVLTRTDGHLAQLFPPPEAPPSRACIRAHWTYAIPAPHQTWRLDAGAHDQLFLVAARHRLADPAALIDRATISERAPDLDLPLRDGRHGAASVHLLRAPEVIVDRFEAR